MEKKVPSGFGGSTKLRCKKKWARLIDWKVSELCLWNSCGDVQKVHSIVHVGIANIAIAVVNLMNWVLVY